MRLITKRYDPNASHPANFDGHINIEECGHVGLIGECRIPDYVVEALEKNRDLWKVGYKSTHCTNCWAHFIGLTIMVPIDWWGPVTTAWQVYNYGWRVNGT